MVADYGDYRPSSGYSITGKRQSLSRTIQIRATDELAAAADTDAPKRGDTVATATGLLYCNNVQVRQVEGSAGDSSEKFLFEVTAVFEPLDRAPVEGKARWTVRSGGDTTKVTAVDREDDQSHYYADAGSVGGVPEPYTGQGINVTEDGAEGVEVDDETEVLTIDMWVAPADVAALLTTIRGLKRHVNTGEFAGPWGSYEAGSCRLATYNVSHIGEDLDQVTLEFLYRPNAEFTIDLPGGQTATVEKLGHEYYWQRTGKLAVSGDDTKAPVALIDAHVAAVYPVGDFSGLGITYAMFDAVEPS